MNNEKMMFGMRSAEVLAQINEVIQRNGLTRTLLSLLSDVQEMVAMNDKEAARQAINRIKLVVDEYVAPQGTYRYLDTSTAHVSQETMRLLEEAAGGNKIQMTVANYEFGAFVSVPPEADYQDNVPEDLRGVLDFARSKGCTVVRLDADGEDHDALPQYEWV